MEDVFYIALQSSLVLGLIHGINPCGHSWLVLAPFVAGDSSGKRVSLLTTAFILGTTAGCIAIALVLGGLSTTLPPQARYVTDIITSGVIIQLGIILIWKPHLLHHHDHDHDHSHGHDHNHKHEHDHHGHQDHSTCSHTHDHEHDHAHKHAHEHTHSHGSCGCSCSSKISARKTTAWGLGTLGFVNMIVPCPTVALMYSYALESASVTKSVAVFSAYALGTAVALAAVIYAIYKVTGLIRKLEQPWIEEAVMRAAGVLTIGFGAYSLYVDMIA